MDSSANNTSSAHDDAIYEEWNPWPVIIENCPHCGSSIDMSSLEPVTDVSCPDCGNDFKARVLFNNFQATELLGQGGMGAVYRAIDVNLQREVALKALKISAGNAKTESQKLITEARSTASVNHPHVVKVYDFGHAQGRFYLAMEVIAGGSLDDVINQYQKVPDALVLEVGIQISQGLQAALEKGLIHRDIKPGNILFSRPGMSKLVDFGLAMALSEAAKSNGEIWGTPYYIAPEKLDEKPEDFRSDIYSLGGTLFHALAGRPPYEDQTASLVALKQLKSRPVSLQAFAPHVGNETAYVINRMMAKNPENRYQSYAELIEHLRFALEKAKEREKGITEVHEIPVLDDKPTSNWIALLVPAVLFIGLLVLGYLWFFTTIFQSTEN